MKKYWLVAKITWEEMFTYRLNFIMWRIRWILGLLMIYFLWLSILPKDVVLFGYNQSLMLTYILGTSFISSIVISSKTNAVGDEINQGNLSNFLIRPINYFKYWFARDVGDKAMNIIFCVFELAILFFVLHPPVFIQTNFYFLFLTLVSIFIALVLFFFINFLLGLIGFWSPEVWAPRFVFYIISNFFAGSLFPLDILPKQIFTVIQFSPFAYLLFFPLKIYLGQLNIIEIYKGLLISIVWTIFFYFVLKYIWRIGLKDYTAQGK